MVLHGSSSARAVKNAAKVAHTFAESKMVDKISSALTKLEEQIPDLNSDMIDSMLSREDFFPDKQAGEKKLKFRKVAKANVEEE